MPYLLVRDGGSGHTREFELSTVRLGRAPGCELLIAGEGREVSSANHARLSFRGGALVGRRYGEPERDLPRRSADRAGRPRAGCPGGRRRSRRDRPALHDRRDGEAPVGQDGR